MLLLDFISIAFNAFVAVDLFGSNTAGTFGTELAEIAEEVHSQIDIKEIDNTLVRIQNAKTEQEKKQIIEQIENDDSETEANLMTITSGSSGEIKYGNEKIKQLAKRLLRIPSFSIIQMERASF